MKRDRLFDIAAAAGLAVWLALFFFQKPPANSDEWARLLLLLAVLVWLPLALQTFQAFKIEKFSIRHELLRYGIFPAGLALVFSFWLAAGWQAAIFALPWVGVSMLIFSDGFMRLTSKIIRAPGDLAITAACLFLPVGSFWALADRLDFQPLDFDPAIVLLTAVHFHYAAFLFPLLAGLAMRHFPSKILTTACWLAVFAVPMTAVGITFSQLWKNFVVEIFAAAMVAVAGWCCALGYFKIVFSHGLHPAVRVLWLVTALSLCFTMTLALLYALRPWLPLEWLNIPSMRAWHGTANAIGVAGCGVLGWKALGKEGVF